MKTTLWLPVIAAAVLSACSTQKQATSYVNDDVYSAPASTVQPKTTPAVTGTATPAVGGAQQVTAPDGIKTQKPASSASGFEQDYNDYTYSSRMKRFNSTDTTKGYFDETYSGSSSDNSSGGPNVTFSLGIGAGFGYPGWGYPGYGYYGYGWGYPYYSWYYPWYDPWYSWYYPYYPYYGGCYCCYGYGYGYDYYPPYAYTTGSYYGSRNTLGSSDGVSRPSSTSSISGVSTTAPRYTGTESGLTSRPSSTGDRPVTTGQETYRYSRPSSDRQSGYQRTTTTAQTTGRGQVQGTTRQQPAPRYIRPENQGAVERTGGAQSYSSPVYRQPKSSQEYLAPRTQNPGTVVRSSGESGERGGSYGNQVRQGSYGTTTRSSGGERNSGTPSYSAPRTSPSYSAPSRSSGNSYSAPSRSGGSYSSPAPSGGGSYSAPSRSGGGGGGSSSGGGGHRR